jgi:hypothetical protein
MMDTGIVTAGTASPHVAEKQVDDGQHEGTEITSAMTTSFIDSSMS